MSVPECDVQKRIADIIREQASSVSLMSEILLSDEDLEYLRKNAKSILVKGFTNDEDGNILSSFMLVDIGIREYDDEGFWSYVERELGSELNARDQKDLFETFSNTLNVLGLSAGPKTKRAYVDKILMHAFVPDKYLDGFYDFVCKTYKTILEFSVDDLDSYSERLSEFMNLFQDSLGDSVKDLDPDIPNPYSLKACTRYALTDKTLSGPLLERIIRMIDAGYKGETYPDEALNRFSESFRKWYNHTIGVRSRRSLQEEMRNRKPHLVFYEPNIKLKIPIQRCRNASELSILIGSEKIVPDEQPRFIKLPGKEPIMVESLVYSLNKLNISPFKEFKVRLDGKFIYKNSTSPYKFFEGENGTESKGIFEGINYVVTENEEYPKNISGCEINPLGNNVYEIIAEPNGQLDLGGKLFNIKGGDAEENQINVRFIRDVLSETPSGEIVPIASNGNVSFLMNTGGRSVLPVIMVRTDGTLRHIPIPTEKQSIGDSVTAFTYVLPDDLGPKEYEIILTCDDKVMCKEKFLLIPGFDYSFDVSNLPIPQYDTQLVGELAIDLEDPFPFNTNRDEIVRPILINNKEYKIKFRVPTLSISIKDDETGMPIWRYPGSFDIAYHEMVNDVIRIRSPVAYKTRLNYIAQLGKKENKEVEQIDRKNDVFFFSVSKLKNMMRENPNGTYDLELSVNSKQRKHLMRIFTHNDYDIDTSSGLTIGMKKNLDTDPFYELWSKGKNVKSGKIEDGENLILSEIKGMVTLFIYEIDKMSLTTEKRLVMQKKYGDIIDSERTPDGYTIYYDTKSVEIPCRNGKDYRFIETQLKSRKRFTPWMTDSVEKEILCHLKQNYNLDVPEKLNDALK